MRYIIVALALGVMTACSSHQKASVYQDTAPIAFLAAHADVGGFAVATIAPVNSYEFKLAPLYTRISVMRHEAAAELRRQEITLDDAQAVQDKADSIRSLLDQAVAACGQDDKTGQCTKNESNADRLLAAATAALQGSL